MMYEINDTYTNVNETYQLMVTEKDIMEELKELKESVLDEDVIENVTTMHDKDEDDLLAELELLMN